MHNNSYSNHELLLGFLCAIALVSVVAAISPFDNLGNLGTKLWSQEAAGWAQAIGTILAIIITYQISSRQNLLSRIAAHEDALRKAKALAQFVVPALKTIESDVAQAIQFCEQYKNIGVRSMQDIDFSQLEFRPVSSTEFILNNAHNLPKELGGSITQLLGFREIVDTNLRLLIERGRKIDFIDGHQLSLLLNWLRLMEKIVVEIFEEIPNIHDRPLSDQIKNLAS